MGVMFKGGWHGLEFPKYGKEIVAQAEKKVKVVEAKIKERQDRIKNITEKKGINVADILGNLEALSVQGIHTYHGLTEGAMSPSLNLNVGEAELLKAEAKAIKEEKQSLDNLNLIIRNLPKEQVFKLQFDQLEYLDF